MPLITYNSGFKLNMSNFNQWEEINVANAATSTTTSLVVFALDCIMKTCKVVNISTNNGAIGLITSTRGVIFDCDISASGSGTAPVAVSLTTTTTRLIACRIIAAGTNGVGVTSTTGQPTVMGNVIYGCGSHGYAVTSSSGSPTIIFNTITANGGDGINIITGTTGLQMIFGNMITDNVGDGVDFTTVDVPGFVAYNRTRDNSANSVTNGGYAAGAGAPGNWILGTKFGDVTTDTGGASTDYTNSGSNDYSLIFASPATNVGFLPYASIGAMQRASTAGSGTGFFVQ